MTSAVSHICKSSQRKGRQQKTCKNEYANSNRASHEDALVLYLSGNKHSFPDAAKKSV
jgi:hypothetical protein